jgi:hypothetical protein
VLWLVYTLGWLPALAGAYAVRPPPGPVPVLTAAGASGALAGSALAISLAILSAAYLVAIRRPPTQRALLAAAAGSLLAALAMPWLFSADVYAYAYYGDVALSGGNPYAHGAPPHDPLAAAAVAAWDGHVPPRCVYGPVAVAIAGLADFIGSIAGAGGQILLQRLAAVTAYAFYAASVLALVPDARARAVFILNPVVIWTVAEGHNDAAMVALLLAGLAAGRERWLLLALAALVKIPAAAVFSQLRWRDRSAAAALVAVGYLPLGVALYAARGELVSGAGTPWQSPLGLLAATVGRVPAVTAALIALGAVALAVRRLPPAERASAFALAAWFALPNAYPWYALWIVPLASRNPSSIWSRALLAASLFAPARAIADAVFRASDRAHAAVPIQPAMIALEFLPPLCVLAFVTLQRRAAGAAAVIVALLLWIQAPAAAQGAPPSPQPAAAPMTPGSATPAPPVTPSPAPAGTFASPSPSPSPSPGAGVTPRVPVPVPLVPPPTPPEPATPTPTAGPLGSPAPASGSPAPASGSPVPASGSPTPASGSPEPSGPPANPSPGPSGTSPPPAMSLPLPANSAPPPTAVPPTLVPTPNPFSYIINPTPVPASTPDGPHILQVELNDRRIRAGGPLLVRVITSANVVGVEARALGRFIPIPQSSPGLFALAYMMPGGIPFWWLNRSYDIVIAAATADGRQTSVSFPMLLTR